jgi:hypothetical protein
MYVSFDILLKLDLVVFFPRCLGDCGKWRRTVRQRFRNRRVLARTIRTYFGHITHRNFQYGILINVFIGEFDIDVAVHPHPPRTLPIVALLQALEAHNLKRGVAALSIVGGEATAIAAAVQ